MGFAMFFPLMPSVKSKSEFDQPFGIMHGWGQQRCALSLAKITTDFEINSLRRGL
jgi:hypothetical protein